MTGAHLEAGAPGLAHGDVRLEGVLPAVRLRL